VILVMLLVAVAATTMALMLFNGGFSPITSFQVTQMIYLQFGIVLAIVMSFALASPARIDDAVSALRAGATFVACWGILQVICFYTGIPYPSFLFNNSTSHFADMYDQRALNLIRIASVGTEPSVMASSLMIFGTFGATLLTVEPRLRTRAMVVPVAITLLVVVASTSSVGYFGLAMLALLLGVRRPGLVVLGLLIGSIGLVVTVILLPKFGEALYLVTFAKSNSFSYMQRTTSMMEALDLFWRSPWVGWGWGSYSSLNSLLHWLANTGLVGTSVFLLAYLAPLAASIGARSAGAAAAHWKLSAYALGMENATIVCLAMSVVSGFKFVSPDIWCLWALTIAVASCLRCAVQSGQRGVVRRLALTSASV
jgi:O-antigen ligase